MLLMLMVEWPFDEGMNQQHIGLDLIAVIAISGFSLQVAVVVRTYGVLKDRSKQ